MLETRNLRKVYKTKKGVSVEALKDVSLKFPETGMVFLLGKSGSGKSTLLNVLGGLDKYDEGEIIIKGVSSKEFKQSHFDSYRNTYVGFIFQEYNVLEEFTVGANIALALELQGRKADDAEINRILTEVDLQGYGDRKPNELSGGQKQRVAIARALIKNPRIIMADEPTGALDSNTGRQVFDTLKKLSKDKLVIVVSHDREFAEGYADRIIELSDGVVISDVEKVSDYEVDETDSTENVVASHKENDVETDDTKNVIVSHKENDAITFKDDEMFIPAGYQLTEQDRIAINEYISNLNTNLKGKIKRIRKAKFVNTNQDSIIHTQGVFELIRSKLSLKNAFKIGSSGLKYKPLRLIITIILSFVAFTLFALADTFGNYDMVKTCTNSIVDSNIKYASVVKTVRQGAGISAYWDNWSYRLDNERIAQISKDTGRDFKGVYVPDEDLHIANFDQSVQLTDSEDNDWVIYATYFTGFADVTADDLKEMDYKLVAGKLPDGSKDEIAISAFLYKTFEKTGYVQSDKAGKVKISKYEDMVGKYLNIGNGKYKVTGIVDTNVDFDRYKTVSESNLAKTSAETLASYALYQELEDLQAYSLTCVAMTGSGRVEKMIKDVGNYIKLDHAYVSVSNENCYIDSGKMCRLSDVDTSKITWVNGEKKQLGEKEMVVTSDSIQGVEGNTMNDIISYLKDAESFDVYYGKYNDSEGKSEEDWKVVGVIDTSKENKNLNSRYIVPDKFYNKGWDEETGKYAFAVASMPEGRNDIKELVKYCYTNQNGVKYQLQNSVTFELDSLDQILKVLSRVFIYIGIGFALFAALMLSNFIATSISYKKQEIGILRAIGARSNDVFRIFFSESFIIAMINFVLACITTSRLTAFINWELRQRTNILVTVLDFGPRQIVLLFTLSIIIAAVASFVPVYRIASKKPVDAIRNR